MTDADHEIELPIATRRELANEWALVLTAESVSVAVRRSETGYALDVPPHQRARALELLAAWRHENRPRPAPPPTPPLGGATDLTLAYAIFLTPLLFHALYESTTQMQSIVGMGSANAQAIVDGAWWRNFTALCLHRNDTHVLGNTLIGGLFFGALARRIGVGVALAATLVSGALGNLANAIHYDVFRSLPHSSIGASTAVFGIVGILSAVEAFRRRGISLSWRRSWVPLGGGLGLLAMLGSGGGRVDVGAHVFGLLAGMLIGAGLAPIVNRRRLGPLTQALAGLSAVALLGLAWKTATA